MEKKVVTISEAFYIELMMSNIYLDMLFSAGVDNWDGISEAEKAFKEYLEKQEEVSKELGQYVLEVKTIEVPDEHEQEQEQKKDEE